MTRISRLYVLWQHNKHPTKYFVRLFDAEDKTLSNYMETNELEVKVFN